MAKKRGVAIFVRSYVYTLEFEELDGIGSMVAWENATSNLNFIEGTITIA